MGRIFQTRSGVITGPDPVIHLLRKTLSEEMDARVKPAHDAAK
jgi:hypothetical protein